MTSHDIFFTSGISISMYILAAELVEACSFPAEIRFICNGTIVLVNYKQKES
jgi:hypothetical protein